MLYGSCILSVTSNRQANMLFCGLKGRPSRNPSDQNKSFYGKSRLSASCDDLLLLFVFIYTKLFPLKISSPKV